MTATVADPHGGRRRVARQPGRSQPAPDLRRVPRRLARAAHTADCAPACRRSASRSASPRWWPCSACRQSVAPTSAARSEQLGTNLLHVQPATGFGRGNGDTARRPPSPMVSRIGPVEVVARLATLDATVRRTDIMSKRDHKRHLRVRRRRRPASTPQQQRRRRRVPGRRHRGHPDGRARIGRRPDALAITDVADGPMISIGGRVVRRVGIIDPVPLQRRRSTAPCSSATRAAEHDFVVDDVVPRSSTCAPRTAPSTPCAACSRPPSTRRARRRSSLAPVRRARRPGRRRHRLHVAVPRTRRRRAARRRHRHRQRDGDRRHRTAHRDRPAPRPRRDPGPHPTPVPDRGAAARRASAALAGVALGAAVTAVYADVEGWPVVIPPIAIVGGFVAAIAIGAIAGLYPAMRAARLAPTEALRFA